MSRIFLNIPDNIENIINDYEEEQFFHVYHAITHLGDPFPIDFYPTFADEQQMKRIRSALNKGGMARVVVQQANNEMSPKYYGVSLFISKEALANRFWRRNKDRYPGVVVGNTDLNKGKAHLDDDSHVSYYLFNYEDESKNPYKDFSEAIIDE